MFTPRPLPAPPRPGTHSRDAEICVGPPPASEPLTCLHLLPSARPSSAPVSSGTVNKRTFVPPAFSNVRPQVAMLSLGAALQVAGELIGAHTLNQDQAAALTQIAHMMASQHSVDHGGEPCPQVPPVTVIQGEQRPCPSALLRDFPRRQQCWPLSSLLLTKVPGGTAECHYLTARVRTITCSAGGARFPPVPCA